jgi:hypothetical protein
LDVFFLWVKFRFVGGETAFFHIWRWLRRTPKVLRNFHMKQLTPKMKTTTTTHKRPQDLIHFLISYKKETTIQDSNDQHQDAEDDCILVLSDRKIPLRRQSFSGKPFLLVFILLLTLAGSLLASYYFIRMRNRNMSSLTLSNPLAGQSNSQELKAANGASSLTWWSPALGSSFQYQLTGKSINYSVAATVIDSDPDIGFSPATAHAKGKKAVCYINGTLGSTNFCSWLSF